jgi:hypothetical protein
MKKFLSFYTVIIVTMGCHLGKTGSSMCDSIKESRKMGFYICEYQPHKVIINDTLQFQIKEAWLEKQWSYGESGNAYERERFQLIVLTEEDIFEKTDYAFSWRIGTTGERNFRSCGSECIMSDFVEIPKDIETWEVQAGSKLDSISIKKIIGTMTLIKK